MSIYDAEEYGVLNTSPCMQTEMYVSVRAVNQRYFSLNGAVTVAIERGDINYTTFLMDYFPEWKCVYYETKEACCQAVFRGEADCVLTSNYRLNLNADLFQKYGLATISTGRAVEFSFAVDRKDEHLYSILNKAIHFTRDSIIDASLAAHSYVEKQFTLADFLREYIIAVSIVFEVILFIILALLFQSRHAERQAKKALRALQESLSREEKQQKELSVTKHKAYTDPLTGVKSKTAYLEVTESYESRMIAGDKLEFATVVFDVNDLKRVNDEQGHEAGDRHIITACEMICDVFKHSPIYRIGGDEFVAILEGKDYRNRQTLMTAFNQLVEYNHRNGKVVVSAGIAEFDPKHDKNYHSVFQRADEEMYQRKRFLKSGREIR